VGSSAAETERTRGGALRVVGREFSVMNVEDGMEELGLNGGKKFGGGGATYNG
jgi:predicted choloylglycine hydrolase